MARKMKKSRGQSAIELAALIVFILGMFLIFQKYIVRGISGRYKGVGDMLGQGRIFDPNETVQCATNVWFQQHLSNPTVWYDQSCFEAQCEEHCLRSTRDPDECWTCMTSTCQSPYCEP